MKKGNGRIRMNMLKALIFNNHPGKDKIFHVKRFTNRIIEHSTDEQIARPTFSFQIRIKFQFSAMI